MERLSYVLDSNSIADYLNGFVTTSAKINQSMSDDQLLYLSSPVHYEVMRGLLKTNSVHKLRLFENELMPQLEWVSLLDDDWLLATTFWVTTKQKGKQLSDIDLLVAAVAIRQDAIIVSADADFDALPIKRENWRLG